MSASNLPGSYVGALGSGTPLGMLSACASPPAAALVSGSPMQPILWTWWETSTSRAPSGPTTLLCLSTSPPILPWTTWMPRRRRERRDHTSTTSLGRTGSSNNDQQHDRLRTNVDIIPEQTMYSRIFIDIRPFFCCFSHRICGGFDFSLRGLLIAFKVVRFRATLTEFDIIVYKILHESLNLV